jgi:membrane fusion protein (multidrug efflux system)
MTQTPPTAAPGRSRRPLIVVTIALVVLAAGGYLIVAPKSHTTTDDAYLKADSTVLAPKVRGRVAQVLVRDNQQVTTGMPVLRIDGEEFDARVRAAEADLQTTRANEQAARASLASLDAEQRLADAKVAAAETSISAATAQRDRAQADKDRYDRLAESGAVSHHDVDLYRANSISAQSELEGSRAALKVNIDQAALTRTHRASLLAGVAQASSAVQHAQAILDLAKQDQANVVLRAPINGIVGNLQAHPGDYVEPGSRLMTLVPLQSLYVLANFKETQTGRMTVGAPAQVEVDALPGVTLRGEVESFAPGSGSEFALLPFEPGNGNFTKIVQRVPVRIRLAPSQPQLARLRPGLSATVVVRLDAQVGDAVADAAH